MRSPGIIASLMYLPLPPSGLSVESLLPSTAFTPLLHLLSDTELPYLEIMGSIPKSRRYSLSQQWPTPHLQQTLEAWSKFKTHLHDGSSSIDGRSLDIPLVVAVSR